MILQIAGEKAADMLNQIHDKEESYQILNMEEIAEGIGQITRIMTIIISSIAGVSLLVGGIGVMNIMLVSVTERTGKSEFECRSEQREDKYCFNF